MNKYNPNHFLQFDMLIMTIGGYRRCLDCYFYKLPLHYLLIYCTWFQQKSSYTTMNARAVFGTSGTVLSYLLSMCVEI